jgi:hypothetical protein
VNGKNERFIGLLAGLSQKHGERVELGPFASYAEACRVAFLQGFASQAGWFPRLFPLYPLETAIQLDL